MTRRPPPRKIALLDRPLSETATVRHGVRPPARLPSRHSRPPGTSAEQRLARLRVSRCASVRPNGCPRFSAGTPSPAAPGSVLPCLRRLSGPAASVLAPGDRRGAAVTSGGSSVARPVGSAASSRPHWDVSSPVRTLGGRRGAAVASAAALSTRGATRVERRFRRRRAL